MASSYYHKTIYGLVIITRSHKRVDNVYTMTMSILRLYSHNYYSVVATGLGLHTKPFTLVPKCAVLTLPIVCDG